MKFKLCSKDGATIQNVPFRMQNWGAVPKTTFNYDPNCKSRHPKTTFSFYYSLGGFTERTESCYIHNYDLLGWNIYSSKSANRRGKWSRVQERFKYGDSSYFSQCSQEHCYFSPTAMHDNTYGALPTRKVYLSSSDQRFYWGFII